MENPSAWPACGLVCGARVGIIRPERPTPRAQQTHRHGLERGEFPAPGGQTEYNPATNAAARPGTRRFGELDTAPSASIMKMFGGARVAPLPSC